MKQKPCWLVCILLFYLVFMSCADSAQEAREALGRLNVTYSEDSFVERARDGDLMPVQLFLQSGMNPNATNKTGQTALVVAARYGREAMLSLLLAHGGDPDLKDREFGATPLIWSAVGGFTKIAAELLDHRADMEVREDRSGMSALHSAAAAGKTEVVDLFLERGMDVNSRDAADRTPLMWAVARGHLETVRKLADDGADLGAREKSLGLSALGVAAVTGRTEIAKLLLEKGAKIDLPDVKGKTPLMLAAQNGRAEALKLLLETGADAGARDEDGRCAFDLASAAGMSECCSLLKDAADASGKPGAAGEVRFKVQLKGKIGHMNQLGGFYVYGTPEEYTITNQNPELLKKLAESGETVTVDGWVSQTGTFLTIEKINGEAYRGDQKPYYGP